VRAGAGTDSNAVRVGILRPSLVDAVASDLKAIVAAVSAFGDHLPGGDQLEGGSTSTITVADDEVNPTDPLQARSTALGSLKPRTMPLFPSDPSIDSARIPCLEDMPRPERPDRASQAPLDDYWDGAEVVAASPGGND